MIKIKKYFFVLLASMALSCNENTSLIDANSFLTDRIIITDSLNLNSLGNDYLKIEDQYISGDFLILRVQYPGGCKEHEVKTYTTKSIIKTNHPQSELFISHNSNNDSCEAFITKTYRINIIELKKIIKSNFNKIDLLLLRTYEPNSKIPVSHLLEYRI